MRWYLMGDFGERLKQLRLNSGLSQQELSDELNIGRSTLANYEQGKREPNFKTLEIIADYFNVDMNFLTGWKPTDSLGDYRKNLLYLKENEPDLIELYNEIHANDQLVILLDKAKKLEPQDLAQILKIIDTFNKETK